MTKPPLSLAWSALIAAKATLLLMLEGPTAWVGLVGLVVFVMVFEEKRLAMQTWIDSLPLSGLLMVSLWLGWSAAWGSNVPYVGWAFALGVFLTLLEQRRISPHRSQPN